MKKRRWARVDRARGESAESWMQRNHDARLSDWRRAKIERGEWVSPEEFEKETGRPGKKLGILEQVMNHVAKRRGR